MKLKQKMLLTFSTLIGCALLVLSLAGYLYTSSVFTQNINDKMALLVDSQVNKLDGWLNSKAQTLQTAQAIIATMPNAEFISESYLQSCKTVDKEISDLYIGTKDGRYIDGSGWTPSAGYDPRTRPWYQQIQANGKITFIKPYLDMSTGKWCASVGMPQKDAKGNFIGILSEDILLDTVTDMAKNISYRGVGHAFILDADGNILANQEKELQAKNVLQLDKFKNLQDVYKTIIAQDQGIETYNYNGDNQITFYRKVPSTGWTLGVTVPTSVIYQPLKALKMIFGAVTLMIIVISIFVILYTTTKMTGPLTELTAHAQRIAGGDLTVQIKIQGEDELAKLGRAFNAMNYHLREIVKAINISGQDVADTAEGMKTAAHQNGMVSGQIADAVSGIAGGASDQLTAIQKELALVEDMAKAVTSVAEDYENSAQLVQGMQNALSSSNTVMDEQTSLMLKSKLAAENVGKTIGLLAEKSDQIGKFVEVITNIAGQTNLLALNAAIEAARAGEQGRGFAVVAEEVRKLAEQSGESAQQIINLVSEIQSTMQQAIKEMDNTATVVNNQEQSVAEMKGNFAKINGAVSKIVEQTAKVQQKAESSTCKAREVQIVSKNIAEVATSNAATTEEVAASVEEQAAAIQRIAFEADKLMFIARKLSGDIAVFKISETQSD